MQSPVVDEPTPPTGLPSVAPAPAGVDPAPENRAPGRRAAAHRAPRRESALSDRIRASQAAADPAPTDAVDADHARTDHARTHRARTDDTRTERALNEPTLATPVVPTSAGPGPVGPASAAAGPAGPGLAGPGLAAAGRASAGAARYTGPLVAPQPPSPPRGLRHKVMYGAMTVVLFVIAAYGLYRITMPDDTHPVPVATDEAGGSGATAPPPTRPAGSANPSASRPVPHPTAPLRDGLDPSGVPMPIGEIPGWYQTFSDDFVGDALNDDWFAYSGQPNGDHGGWFDPAHVSVGKGILTISAYQEQTPNGNIYATGGISNHNVFSQKYGRFDVRFRMDRGTGIAYALLLWPTSNKWPPEIDIVEDNGGDRQSTTSTMHWDPDDKKIQKTTNADFTKWHTATMEWTPGQIVYLLDGKVWGTINSPHVPDEPMDLGLQTQAWGCGGTWEHCPNSTTPPVVNLQVDWVSLYEWTGP